MSTRLPKALLIAGAVALGTTGAVAPAAFAKHGADDAAGHVRGHHHGGGADDGANHKRHGADDGAGHVRHGGGKDDPAGHR